MTAGPLGRRAVERFADAALTMAGAAGVELVVQHAWGGFTRFANSAIHQNQWAQDILCNVRVVTGDGRVGVAATHTDDPGRVSAAAREALALARLSPPDPSFPGLAGPAAIGGVTADDDTMRAGPGRRAEAVRAALAEVPDAFRAAGALSTGGTELAVYTTAGQRAYTPWSSAQLNVIVDGPSSSGYAEAGGRTLAGVDPAASARLALSKARAAADPREVPPGSWPVVLEPAAAGTLVQFLAYLGLGGREYLERRSFATGRMGEQVADRRVTVVDDARSPDTVGPPFDYEGVPKRRVELIRAGVLAGVVHDRFTAARAGAESTGHGLMAPNPHGPIAANALLLPGDGGSVGDLVGGLERGLLVTRFHYTNVVHPLETTVTGMTRDGTFLVEDGRVTGAVRNLRFTQSILHALAAVDAVGSQTAYATDLFATGSRFPALRLPAFHFTGTTTFG